MPDPDRPAAASPAGVFHRLVDGVGRRRLDDLPALYAEQTQVRHPLDPRRPPPLTTRQQLAEHFAAGFETLGEIRFEAAAITVHQTTDPEVVIGEFEYRGLEPGTGEPFAIPNIFVLRVRDGQIVESRDYADHAALGRLLSPRGEPAEARPAAAGWRAIAQRRYEDAVFAGDYAGLDTADAELRAVEADLSLARCRITHSRFLAGGPAEEATLRQAGRAAGLYAALGDARGEAEARFWMALYHQVARGDHETARPLLERAEQLAIAADDRLTLSYVARHLGAAEEAAGRPDAARQRYEQSLALRRETGFQRGVAAALLTLAELTAQQGDPAAARELLAEADAVARAHDAAGIRRSIGQAQAELAGRS